MSTPRHIPEDFEVPRSMKLTLEVSCSLNMGVKGFPETSLTVDQATLREISEERSYHLLRNVSMYLPDYTVSFLRTLTVDVRQSHYRPGLA